MYFNFANGHATANLVNAGLTNGTTSTYTTTAATVTILDGVYSTALAAQTNTATPTTDHHTGAAFTTVAVSKGCVFVFGITAAGAIAVTQGPIVDLDSSNNFKSNPLFPYIPGTMTPIGYVIINNGSTGSNWTFGSSSFGATGITDTWKNIYVLPDRPTTS